MSTLQHGSSDGRTNSEATNHGNLSCQILSISTHAPQNVPLELTTKQSSDRFGSPIVIGGHVDIVVGSDGFVIGQSEAAGLIVIGGHVDIARNDGDEDDLMEFVM